MHQLVTLALGLFATSIASAQTTLFHEDFEGGLAEWSVQTLWHLEHESDLCGSEAAPFPSSNSAAYFGQFQGYCNFLGDVRGSLAMLQPVHIPAAATSARLAYWTFEETECIGTGNCGWDHRTVLVSVDGGQQWTEVAWGGAEGAWRLETVDLSAYIGQDVLVRFEFDAIDQLWNDFLGWMVDDITIAYDATTPYCTAKVNSQGCTPILSYTGQPSVSELDDPLTVTATQLINNTASKLVCSRQPNALPFHGGTLCVGIPAARTTVRSSFGSPPGVADCSGVYTFEFTPDWLAQKSYLAGETMHVQFTGRDPGFAPPGNHSLSAGLFVTFTP